MLDEGTTFIFSSWVCIVDGSSGFRWHLVNDMKLEASVALNVVISMSSLTMS
jgi:hypothetical protein